MMDYYVLEIAGKQYLAEPKKELLVSFLGDVKEYKCDKVLLKSDGGKVEVGAPYLKDTVLFEVLGIRKNKVRVATYHAKANARTVVGANTRKSIIKMKSSVKKG